MHLRRERRWAVALAVWLIWSGPRMGSLCCVRSVRVLSARRVTLTIVTRLLPLAKVLWTRCVFCWRRGGLHCHSVARTGAGVQRCAAKWLRRQGWALAWRVCVRILFDMVLPRCFAFVCCSFYTRVACVMCGLAAIVAQTIGSRTLHVKVLLTRCACCWRRGGLYSRLYRCFCGLLMPCAMLC